MKHETMDEQFDNKLTDRIREVFDNYEYPPAEKGWAELRKKFPAEEKNNKVAWLWWSSAAAVLLVVLSIGLWHKDFKGTQDGQHNMAVKPAVKPNVPKDSAVITSPVGEQPVIAQTTPATKPVAPYTSPYTRSLGVSSEKYSNTGRANAYTPAVQQPPVTLKPEAGVNLAHAKEVVTSPKAIAIDSQKVLNQVKEQPQLAQVSKPAEVTVTQPQPNNTAASTATKPQQSAIMAMFEQEKQSRTAQRKNTEKLDKKVTFSVYAATYFNYSEGSANQVNAGAGVTSDFRLSKKLKLSTGVALAQNSLSYGSVTQAPQTRAATALVASAPVLKSEGLFAISAAMPVFRNYNVNMVGLDIPINLKYEINPDKTDAFISAGLSSGTFIDENYTYKYTYSNSTVANGNAVNQDQSQTAHNSFSNFYFGKMLNVSFGVGYPVGGNRLVIEPFVKYPLGGLGAQDIKFGSGGVNLKFSFKGGKR